MLLESYTLDQIRDEIINFKNDSDFQKLEDLYYSKSFSEILGVSRRELSHSGFIAWLLNNLESHKLGFFAIKKIFDIIFKFSNDIQKKKYYNIFNSIITDDFILENINIQTEFSIKNVGRVDILLELDLFILNEKKHLIIVFENKVESKENNDQTFSYYNHFNQLETENNIIFYIYLTPISTLDLIELIEPECSCKYFIQINYQSLVDYLIEPALNQNISNRSKNILNEYLKSLSQPSIDEFSDEHKKELIMALGNEERKLLSSFWNKNQKLILASLYAISSDPDQDKDTRDSIKGALESLSTERDKSTITIKYYEKVFVQNIKKSDIGLQTVKLLESSNLINDDIIEYLKNDKSSSFLLLKTIDQFTETEIKYRKYKTNEDPELFYNGVGYFVVRNWGIGNIDKFIQKFSSKFDGLIYEINKNS